MMFMYSSESAWYCSSDSSAGTAWTGLDWTLGGLGSSESGKMPLDKDNVLEMYRYRENSMGVATMAAN